MNGGMYKFQFVLHNKLKAIFFAIELNFKL